MNRSLLFSAPIFLGTALCLPLCLPIHGDNTYQNSTLETTDSLWDSSLSGAYGQLQFADFDGDAILDAAQLQGSQLQVMLAPDTTAQVFSSLSVTAFCTTVDVNSGHNIMIIATATDLQRIELTETGWLSTIIPVTNTGWHGANLLRRREVGANADQILAVASDGVTVLAMTDVGSGYVEASSNVLTNGKTILDLNVFERNGDGVSELCLIEIDGIRTFDVSVPAAAPGSETWIETLTWGLPGYALIDATVGAQAQGGTEWVAVLGLEPSGLTQVIAFVSNAGLTSVTSLPSNLDVIRIGAGDWNGDDNQDLALSWRSSQEIGVIPNSGGPSPSLDLANLETYPLSLSPSSGSATNLAEPTLVDVDNDGDLDLAMSVQETGQLRMIKSAEIKANDQRPLVTVPGSSGLTQNTLDLKLDAILGLYGTSLQTVAPNAWPPAPLGTSYDELEVQSFYIPTGTSSPVAIDPPQYYSVTTSLPPNAPLALIAPRLDAETSIPFIHGDYYFFRIRLVARSGGVLVAAAPAQVFGFHASGTPGVSEAQLVLWGGTEGFDVNELDPQDTNPVIVGRGFKLPKLPPPGGPVGFGV